MFSFSGFNNPAGPHDEVHGEQTNSLVRIPGHLLVHGGMRTRSVQCPKNRTPPFELPADTRAPEEARGRVPGTNGTE